MMLALFSKAIFKIPHKSVIIGHEKVNLRIINSTKGFLS